MTEFIVIYSTFFRRNLMLLIVYELPKNIPRLSSVTFNLNLF